MHLPYHNSLLQSEYKGVDTEEDDQGCQSYYLGPVEELLQLPQLLVSENLLHACLLSTLLLPNPSWAPVTAPVHSWNPQTFLGIFATTERHIRRERIVPSPASHPVCPRAAHPLRVWAEGSFVHETACMETAFPIPHQWKSGSIEKLPWGTCVNLTQLPRL